LSAPDLLTLAEAARLIPGANVNTLKRRARQGKLAVYRMGRAWLTTREAISEMVESCRVIPRVRDSIYAPPPKPARPAGLSEMALANLELDSMLTQAMKQKRRH
jgi:hypothetical protein